MKKLLCLGGFLLICMMVSNASASIVVIDFDKATPGEILTSNYYEDGFTMQCFSGHYDIWGPNFPIQNDTLYLGMDWMYETSIVQFTSGSRFSMLSIEVVLGDEPGSQSIRSSAGGFVDLSTAGIQTFSAPEWTDIFSITLYSNATIGGPGFDNIKVNTVPIPAAAWLLGTGFASLIALNRKRQN